MITDWIVLAKRVGSLKDDGSQSGGDTITKKALDEILGDEWIEHAVETAISLKGGSELAMSCLSYISSTKATQYAYKIYESSQGVRARQAVWLIKHLANPISYYWIKQFLNDGNVIDWGLGVLDQLLWTEQIPYDENVKLLLDLANRNSRGQLKDFVDFIHNYLELRERR